MTIGFSLSAGIGFFTSANPIIPSPSTSLLLPVVLNMTKFFYIREPVTIANNNTIANILKDTIWIAGVPFPSLDKAWQYMLGISNHAHRLEVAKNITHQQVLSQRR